MSNETKLQRFFAEDEIVRLREAMDRRAADMRRLMTADVGEREQSLLDRIDELEEALDARSEPVRGAPAVNFVDKLIDLVNGPVGKVLFDMLMEFMKQPSRPAPRPVPTAVAATPTRPAEPGVDPSQKLEDFVRALEGVLESGGDVNAAVEIIRSIPELTAGGLFGTLPPEEVIGSLEGHLGHKTRLSSPEGLKMLAHVDEVLRAKP